MTSKLLKYMPRFLRAKIEHRPELLKILNNIGWLFIDKVLRMGVGLLVGVWVARYLGPEQYGLLNYAMAFVGLFGAIATLGLQGIIVRDLVMHPNEVGSTLGTGFVLRLLGGLLAYLFIILIISYLRPDDTLAKIIVAILGFTLIIKASEVVKYWYEAQVQSKFVVWIENGVFLIMAIVKIIMILLHAPLMAFVLIALVNALLVAIILLIVYRLKVSRLKYWKPSFSRAKELLQDSWPLILAGLAVAVYMKIDQIMLGQMVGDEAVGIYSAAVRISEVWYLIPMAIVGSVYPSIIEAKKKSEKLYYQRLQKIYNLMTLIALSIALPMTFLSSWIIKLLFGAVYAPAGPVLAIHIWAALFVFLGVASGKWFLTENRQLLTFQRTLLGAVVNVILNIFVIPKYGAIGAAYTTVIAYAMAGFFSDVLQKETRPMFIMKLKSFNIYSTIQSIWK